MASNTQKASTSKGSKRAQDDWEDEQEAKVIELQRNLADVTAQLNALGGNYNTHSASVKDHLEQLHAQVVASAPASAAPVVKLPKAEPFDGTRTKLRGFLTQMRMHLDVNRQRLTDEESKVIFVSTHLRGQAWDWFEVHIREYYEKPRDEWNATTHGIFTSYSNFVAYLTKMFGEINATVTAERKLASLRQTTSTASYATQFMQIAAVLGWADYALIPRYVEGLKSHVKDELARVDRPTAMTDIIDLTTRFDNRYFDRQQEKREVEQWRKNPGRGNRFQPRNSGYRAPKQDDYGPRPMELDAARLPDEEQKRRKDGNLCFKCGKPGHRIKDCRSRSDRPAQQIRATRERGGYNEPQRLYAIQQPPQVEERDEPEEAIDELLRHWTNLGKKEIQGARNSERAKAPSPTGSEFPEIDWKNNDTEIESQGWTQYGDWNDTSSQDLVTKGEGITKQITPTESPTKQKPKVTLNDPLLNELIKSVSADDHASTRPEGSQQLAATQWGAHLKIEASILLNTVRVLIDSGACGNFMDPACAERLRMPLRAKNRVVPITGLNGESLGPGITHETEPQPMIIGNHFEIICFDLSPLGGYEVVLGMPWLRFHNPIIGWSNTTIQFKNCQCRPAGRIWTGKEKKQPKDLGTGASDPEDAPQRKNIPPPKAIGRRPIDMSIIGNLEQRPNMSDDELKEYVMVHEELTAFCATGEGAPELPAEYQEFQDVFTPPPIGQLPEHGPHDHEINLMEGKEPTHMKIYQLSEKESQVLKEYIEMNLEKGYIRHSTSSAGYPILFVPKKDGSLRLCVDYRQLNSITKKDRHPLPLIQEIQDRIHGAKYFSKFDITEAYNHLRIKAGDEWKTAFRTKFGHYEYTVMPFGLTNAPASFQRFIFSVLEDYLDVFVVAYLDDILVFSKTVEEHREHNRKVLQKLREARVTLKLKKCEFHVQETGFLGYVISSDKFSMEEEKVRSVLEWPQPRNLKEVQQFLGLCNYYRRSIDGFGATAAGLNKLTKKDQQWNWDKEAEKSFNGLKELFRSRPILHAFNPELPVVVETDASDYALGARMTQDMIINNVGGPKVIAFWSRKMIPAELNYDIHDKELLAIVSAFKVWRPYLEGAKHQVLVRSDHKNLTFFTTTKELTRRQARWAETLSQYDYRIEHCDGRANSQADALSRRPDYKDGVKEAVPAILTTDGQGNLVYNHQTLAATSELQDDAWLQQIKEATSKDDALQQMLDDESRQTILDEGILLMHGLIYVPGSMQGEIIQKHHDEPTRGHLGIEKTVELITRHFYIPNVYKKVRKYIGNCDTCLRDKPTRHLPYGEMQISEVPKKPWEWITMDFITKLPESEGHDMIMVIVDKLTKYAYMIPTTEKIDAKQMASILVRNIFANHGTPRKITSDRDKLFTSNMWRSFADQIGIEHRLSTAYHPQTNGQTERTNQTLEQYLRHYVNYQQNNWSELLPVAQFAYNNAMHATTKESPFFANYGYNPTITGEPIGDHTVAESSRILVTEIKQLHLQMSRDIEFVNLRMKNYYDKNHKEGPELQKGEKVYLLRRNIKTKRPSDKLDHKRLGPFSIEEKTGPVNYKLKLPQSMKRIHPVFHISLLEKAPNNAEIAINVEIEDAREEEYEVEKILADRWSNSQQQLLVKWQGYPTSENTWEPIKNLRGCHQLVEQYYQKEKKTPEGRKLRKRRNQRQTSRPILTPDQTQSSASE